MKSAAIATLLTLASLFAAVDVAQAQGIAERVYVSDTRGEVVKSGSGSCWRTGYWTPAAAANDVAACVCDKDLMAKEQCEPAIVARPAPAPIQPPLPATSKKCDFSSVQKDDQVFVFKQATLQPGAQARIDAEVVDKLATCAEVKLVLITGHADRLGSQRYNQKLSEKRANAVKAYLVKKGVNADVIEIMGAGKTQPLPGVSCSDTLSRKKLIECLAPNRRTVIEVQGLAK